jgi:N-acetylmuramoyl-L-alanine amidase
MGDSEEDHTFEICKKTEELLKDYDCNVYVISKDVIGSESDTLNKVVNLSNDFATSKGGQSFHIDVHTDGGYKGKGASGFYFSENGRQFISIIHNEVSRITPWLDGGIAERDLYVLRKTTATAGLVELSFHDIYEQAKHIHENMDLYAQALCRGLVRACGLQKKKIHWAESFYNYLNEEGIEVKEKRFEDYATRAELMAIVANSHFKLKGGI